MHVHTHIHTCGHTNMHFGSLLSNECNIDFFIFSLAFMVQAHELIYVLCHEIKVIYI